ncbi:hypothetical protein FBEOM_11825 [Fusarium beomiforme]|uniref:Uncharacterized protein n=1 Tax=Fusarium beomiforme TaxID=44412 RepID=A0A9P5DRD0_9HYPO|nr:hypothetical protein FBEOM_11825 [Fusarium beomiforme]
MAKLEEIVMRLAKASEASKEGSDAAYHGETSWEAVFKSIHDIQSVLNTQNEPDQYDDLETSSPAPDIAIGGISSITLDDVINGVPSRQDADVLVSAYFKAKFLAVPFIHERHFWRRYELFWACAQSSNFLWLSIMFSVLGLDTMLGMSPMAYQEVCDTGYPRNLSDDDFDEDTSVPESRPSTEPTPMLAWQTKSHLYGLLRRILQHVLRVESPPYEETMALQAELEVFHNSVPDCLRIRPIEKRYLKSENSVH